MDLSTTYMGFALPHPLMVGSGPLCGDLDAARRLEQAGAAGIVLPTLFEEQVGAEEEPGALTGPEDHLGRIQELRDTLEIPVFASLHGDHAGWWRSCARQLEQAGASGLELNFDELVSDPALPVEELDRRMLAVVASVKSSVKIPVAVKLAGGHGALSNLAQRLGAAGADGLVLFNRPYRVDFDLESMDVVRNLAPSDPSELAERLRWLAILSGQVEASLAATGGVHGPLDVIKAVMAGAHAVQMVSALLAQGPGLLETVLDGMRSWMEENGHPSLRQLQGCLSLRYCPDPRVLERAGYAPLLQSPVVEGF